MASLRQLNSLIAVYEEGSFTAASERENATQSGISQHISAIEKELELTYSPEILMELFLPPYVTDFIKNLLKLSEH